MQGRWGEMPFLPIAACLALGIAASVRLEHYSFPGIAAGSTAVIFAAGAALGLNRPRTALALGLAAVSLGGLLMTLAQRDGLPQHHISSLIAAAKLPLEAPVEFEACVLEEPSPRAAASITLAELRAFRQDGRWVPSCGRTLIRLPLPDLPPGDPVPGAELRYGDRIRGWAILSVPRNFGNPGAADTAGALARKDIGVIARVKSPRLLEVLPGDCRRPWQAIAAGARETIKRRLQEIGRDSHAREAAVLAAIMIGDYSRLEPATREIFQNAGTYHVLVVSGLHVGWIAWLLTLATRLLFVPQRAGRILVAAGILFYALVVGFQASVSRCLWMFGLCLLGQALFRSASPANVAAAAAFFLMAFRPYWLFDTGFQLSFVSVMAIVLLALPWIDTGLRPLTEPLRRANNPERLHLDPGPWSARGRALRTRAELLAEAIADRIHPLAGRSVLWAFRILSWVFFAAGGMFLISLAIQFALSPLMAFHFNRLSWIGPFANLAVMPLASATLAAGLLATAAGGLPPETWLTPAALRVTSALLETTAWITRLPGAWQRCATPTAGATVAAMAVIFCLSLPHRRRWLTIPAALGLTLAFASGPGGAILRPEYRAPEGLLRLSFLDIGQGESLVIRFPDGRIWVQDAGGFSVVTENRVEESHWDPGEMVVSRYLWWQGVRFIDRILISHPHQDHAGGGAALLRNFGVQSVLMSEVRREDAMPRLLAAARSAGVPVRLSAAGREEHVGGVRVRVLHPPEISPRRSLNDNSMVVRLDYGRFSVLLTGDIETRAELELLAGGHDLRSLLLKVAHHGSRSSSREALLDKIGPRWAVISAGRGNPFGNPSKEVVFRLLRRGARPLITFDHGAIFFETDGAGYRLSSHRAGKLESGTLPVRQPALNINAIGEQ